MHRTLLIPVAAAACTAHRPAPAEPAAPLVGELQRLAFYVGDWSCTGTQFATATEPERTWAAQVHVRPDAGGGVLAVHMVGPGDNLTAELKGYDPTAKRWYHLWTARDGSHGAMSAGGWDGDRMIATDEADPKHRTVFTQLGPDQYSHRDEVDAGAGFVPVWEKRCARL